MSAYWNNGEFRNEGNTIHTFKIIWHLMVMKISKDCLEDISGVIT